MKTVFTPEELKDYFNVQNKNRLHYFYEKSVKYATDIRIHADGIFPELLINERRPNETLEVLAYRKKIFIAKTKPFFSKIESTLQKIRRSSDWNINYKNSSFDRIVEDENLEAYAEKNYPTFTSITNWAFSVLLRQYLIDANSVVLVSPFEIPELENEYIKPIANIFCSDEVIDFVDNDYAVLVNRLGAMYLQGKTWQKGESYYVVTTQSIFRYDQINGRRVFAIGFQYDHMLNELPVFKLGGIVREVYGNSILYESRISGIVPEFNEALREYSDLQAAKVLHLFPERWEYTQNECVSCKGTGRRMEIIDETPCQVTCTSCQGHGYIATGPYAKTLIKPSGVGEQPSPTPPAGFIEKDVEIIKVQDQSIKDHIFYGLASINFEFLAEKPLATSGIKTAMDGDEMNNTVHSIAEDLVAVLDKIYRLNAIYRYSTQYRVEEIEEMLPDIAVPEKYDILSATHLEEQLSKAKLSKVNSTILNELEIAFAGKIFNNDPDIANHVRLVLSLDPFAGKTEDEKMGMLSNNGITKEDYVLSSNINLFVDKAIEDNPNFLDLETKEQREIVMKFAIEQVATADDAQKIIDSAFKQSEEQDNQEKDQENDKNNSEKNTGVDIVGKIPLAVQQLALAATRANELGDKKLTATIKQKLAEILSVVDKNDII